MNEVIIIGGGASGLVSAIYASKQGSKVTLLEKNSNLGKKILITGNGKCNYWNSNISIDKYNTSNKEILSEILKDKNQKEIMTFFNNIGIIPKIKDNLYYPYSSQATSIQTALIKECEIQKVKIITNCEVKEIKKEKDLFTIISTKGTHKANKVIISTGSFASPKTGSTGDGYKFAKYFKHTIITPLPSLVQLKANEPYLKEWHGIRTDVSVTLKENDIPIKKEVGEIQLTDYGVSGICIFNLSSIVSKGLYKNKKEQIVINFLNSLSINKEEDFIKFMNNRNNTVKKRNISELLDGLLNYKLTNLILKLSKIKREEKWNDISINNQKQLASNLIRFTINITGTNSFDTSQTCTGGIPLSEINSNTMESLKEKNLYITGELLDADGICGGFNLAFAWITGMLAGIGVNND